MLDTLEKKRLRLNTYLAGFLISTHLAFNNYINSSFLSEFMPYEAVGIIFSAAAILGIMGLYLVPLLLKKIDLVQLMASLVFCLIFSVLFMINSSQAYLVIGFFALYYVLGLLIIYLLDLYLEKHSDDESTGQVRSLYIVIIHLAMVMTILIVGSVLRDNDNYYSVYILSLLPLIPLIYLFGNKFKKVSLLISKEISWKKIYNDFYHPLQGSREANIKNILIIDYILNLFNAFMLIYLPIYLNQYLGIPWSSIGFILAFMFLPFIIFPYPLGRLADNRLGEKEILTGGIIILSLSTLLIATLSLPSVLLWSALLFLNQIGNSAVITMKESYLFKQITASDIGVLSVSRNTRPLAAITGPLMATIILIFFPFPFLFIFIGLFLLIALYPIFILKDTR